MLAKTTRRVRNSLQNRLESRWCMDCVDLHDQRQEDDSCLCSIAELPDCSTKHSQDELRRSHQRIHRCERKENQRPKNHKVAQRWRKGSRLKSERHRLTLYKTPYGNPSAEEIDEIQREIELLREAFLDESEEAMKLAERAFLKQGKDHD